MLEVHNISFSYGEREVLRDVSFTVAPGQAAVLAGANGAGKTTLLRILAGLLIPTAGTVRVDDYALASHPLRYRRALGYLPETAPVEPGLTVRAYLKFRAALKGEQYRRIRHRVNEALAACGLEEHASVRIGRLSLGTRRRVALAEAILLRPRFLLLDDPLAGLDVPSREAVVKVLSSLSAFSSILVAGHELEDLGRIASRFLVLKAGNLSVCESAASARAALAGGGAS